MGWSGNWNKKRICLISIAGILVFIICIFGVNLYFSVYGEEWNAIQSIANNIDDYEVEIERWGYQVSIYDPMSGNTSTENDFALINYAEGVYDPVLILTDQAGGRWYFYNGFDQYAQETESIELMPLMDGDEEALRIITQLQLYKTRQDQPPQKENIAQPDTRAYYDVTVKINFDGYSQETGEYVRIKNSGPYDTQYCSNNFEECKRYWGIDPVRANRRADEHIKERFTAEQLLEFYQQGLALQERLIELYRSNS